MVTDNSKKSVVILTGNSIPAISGVNVYTELLSARFNVFVIEENIYNKKNAIPLIKKVYKKNGAVFVVNILFLRLIKLFLWREMAVSKKYLPDLKVACVNCKDAKEFIEKKSPEYIITNACSILTKDLLDSIGSRGIPVINLHNGITPRYRGKGIFWAFFEENYSTLGSTIHYVNESIDSGERIRTVKLDFSGVNFHDIDKIAFQEGAKAIVDFVLNKKTGIDPEFISLEDRYYSFPGFTHYLKAMKNFNKYKSECFFKKKN